MRLFEGVIATSNQHLMGTNREKEREIEIEKDRAMIHAEQQDIVVIMISMTAMIHVNIRTGCRMIGIK
jgi:hypothetical protein